MKIEVNYQDQINKELDEKIGKALKQIGAKQYCRGYRSLLHERYIWFDLADELIAYETSK